MLKAALRVLAATALAAATLTVTAPADATTDRAAAAKAAGPDTGPCGPVRAFRSFDWWRTTTSPGLFPDMQRAESQERWQWRDDHQTLWRGDGREDTQQIFDEGFTPRGPHLSPLNEYIVKGGGQHTAHLSTSCEKWVAEKFATYGAKKTGWVYEIEAPGGIDVNATAHRNGYESPYLWNKEIDFPGGIRGEYIKRACKYHLVRTDPVTKVNTYENLGCRTNRHFAGALTPAA
ncbi:MULTISPECIES: scabin-related ADP-ribosyltransferase [Streptomyces]|uniref:Pierisin-like domain-containing protein n=1 Tax=Streptomyces ramulosus TaxID=47762 RepID=A0ABW1FQP7_9ACTN